MFVSDFEWWMPLDQHPYGQVARDSPPGAEQSLQWRCTPAHPDRGAVSRPLSPSRPESSPRECFEKCAQCMGEPEVVKQPKYRARARWPVIREQGLMLSGSPTKPAAVRKGVGIEISFPPPRPWRAVRTANGTITCARCPERG
jgi:hypothetical protein